MSNLSGLPPAAVARAASIATSQDVAVKLMNLPDGLKNNPQPIKLSGVVEGQTPDGYVQIKTDRGVISILLKDRGSLPTGQTIEIDVLAGRPPQQAAIRPQPQSTQTTQQAAGQNATPNSPTSNPLINAAIAPPVKLDRPQTLKSDELAEALSSLAPGEEIPLAAPLQAGQTLRLIPISMQPNSPLNTKEAILLTPEELLTSLMNMIGQATDLSLKTRQDLVQILSRIDLSTLLPTSGEETGASHQEIITSAFQKLVQAIDLPETIKLQNASLQNSPSMLFNSARPLDVRILAFQNGNFQAALSQAQTAGTGTAQPVLIPENFIVLPQPAAPQLPSAATNPTPVLPQTVPGQPALQTPSLTEPAQGPLTPPQVQPPPLQGTTASPQIPAQPTPPSQPPTLLGQVTGFTPQGQPIVSLAIPGSPVPQNYAVQFVANNIIEGSPVIVSPLPAGEPIAQKAGLVPFAIGTGQSLESWAQPEIWDSLQTLIGAASHINPAIAQTLTQMLPSAAAPQNLGALSLFFLAVMRSADINTWVGAPVANLLKAGGKIDILRAMAGDSVMSNRLEAAPLPNDWKAAIFPFWHDQQVHKLPLYYKSWNDEKDQEADEIARKKKMRFMFELKLSRMGPVQVDGFMQREKLDMILRTKSIISIPMQQALKMTYTKAMERSNLSGEITFQFKPEQWVHVDMPLETLG